VAGRPERFILFCDDLSFELSEAAGYKALKVVLDGSITATSENLLIYATSNRRHLMPEYMQENLETKHLGEEIHPAETVEEKISLPSASDCGSPSTRSTRTPTWISRDTGARARLQRSGDPQGSAGIAAVALLRGSRSGRVAWQFARDYAGRNAGDAKARR